MKRLAILLLTLVSCQAPSVIIEENPAKNVSDSIKAEVVRTTQDAVDATVKIDFGYSTGTGFVIKYEQKGKNSIPYYEILTAAHIFTSDPEDPYKIGDLAGITFFIEEERKYMWGSLAKVDEERDLALIKMYDIPSAGGKGTPMCHVFSLEPSDEYLDYDTQLYLVGYPQGVGPMVTRGYISGIRMLAHSKDSFTTTAQSAPGSSGGPVAISGTGKVVGMLRAVIMMRASGELLTWCSIITPVSRIRAFLREYYDEASEKTSEKISIIKMEASRGASFSNEENLFVFLPYPSSVENPFIMNQ